MIPEKAPLKGSIRGQVRTETGEMVTDATVVVVESPGSIPAIAPLTNDLGEFAMDELPAGSYRLRAVGDGTEIGEATVHVADGSTSYSQIVVRRRS